MINKQIFTKRRTWLKFTLDGAILIPGSLESPKNYAGNTYPFRQNSHFLYLGGPPVPSFAILLMPDGEQRLYGTNRTNTQIIWQGPAPTVEDYALKTGFDKSFDIEKLGDHIKKLSKSKTQIHYLPPFRDTNTLQLEKLLDIPHQQITDKASVELAKTLKEMRAVKIDEEVEHIEKCVELSHKMYLKAASIIKPGVTEAFVAGAMQGLALQNGATDAFLPIVTTRGEVLHNNFYGNTIKKDDLVLIDTGVELSPFYYSTDITRTYPASGKFTSKQQDIYEIVLAAQEAAIKKASPALPTELSRNA